MSTPSFKTGPITYDVAEDVSKFRLVEVTAEGVKHATAAGPVHGAIAENGYADPEDHPGIDTVKAARVAVRMSPETTPVEVSGDATAIEQGAPLYAAADGKVSATGTVLVGFATRPGYRGRVSVTLLTPVFPA
ncbi:hypothetical protein NYP18_09165 [Corynebacterium sp. YIM 101645]|uniref:DUF2190 domain-containing protein n=1 Tax=Corynebacterium lemuris TaxID=1859292 RepID=A0ABT2FX62_9CORY|nr:hypothetical protein [Corynebacterium lemuris]MCS5479828.1 hypothetical protein [Corynebacterium lemuris]